VASGRVRVTRRPVENLPLSDIPDRPLARWAPEKRGAGPARGLANGLHLTEDMATRRTRTSTLLFTMSLSLLLLSQTVALADPVPFKLDAPPPAQPAREWKLAAVQATTGALAIAAVSAGALAMDTGSDVLLLAGPAAAGATVCAVGSASDHYRGNCLATIGGAFVGTPAALIVAFLAGGHSGHGLSGDGAALATAATWVLVPPLTATATWHLTKRRRQPPPVTPVAPATPDARLRPAAPVERRAGLQPPGQVMLRLAAASF